MAFNLNIPNNAFRQTPQEAGYGDYGEAFNQGVLNSAEVEKAINTPKMLAEQLLSAKLDNKIKQPKADYATQITLADIANKQASSNYKSAQTEAMPTLTLLRKAQIEADRIKRKYPGLGQSGIVGKLAYIQFLNDHPHFAEHINNQRDKQLQDTNQDQYDPSQEPAQAAEQGEQVEPDNRQAIMGDDGQFIDSNDPGYAQALMQGQQQQAQAQRQDQQMQQGTSPLMPQGQQQPQQVTQRPDEMVTAQQAQPVQQEQSGGKSYKDMILDSINADVKDKKSKADYQQKRANGFAYSTAPVAAKEYMIAQAAGMGINPDTATNEFSKGKLIEDLAKEHGFDPNNLPEPDFLPTKGNVTKLKDRQAALAEMKSLSEKVQKGIGKYSSTILGWSPKQLADYASGLNKDKQVEFYAARAILPELTNMRLLTSGAKNTVHGIRSMQEKALFNIKAMQSGMPSGMWQSIQKKTDDWIEEAMGKSMKAYGLKGGKLAAGESKISAPAIPSTVTDSESFKKWKATLTPEQVEALRREHVGE